MVAFSGSEPIGVLIGGKRPSATLVHKIAVHPDHRRQGHGRHMLTSLGSKLAILGPPRIVAEVPETLVPACKLFGASGYVQETILTDYVFDEKVRDEGIRHDEFGMSRLVIPVTIDDLDANGLLGAVIPEACWDRSIETLTARKEEIEGLAVVSEERIEAYILYLRREGQIVSLRSVIEDDGSVLRNLAYRIRARCDKALLFPKVHPAEFSTAFLEELGFRRAGAHRLYAAKAQAE